MEKYNFNILFNIYPNPFKALINEYFNISNLMLSFFMFLKIQKILVK